MWQWTCLLFLAYPPETILSMFSFSNHHKRETETEREKAQLTDPDRTAEFFPCVCVNSPMPRSMYVGPRLLDYLYSASNDLQRKRAGEINLRNKSFFVDIRNARERVCVCVYYETIFSISLTIHVTSLQHDQIREERIKQEYYSLCLVKCALKDQFNPVRLKLSVTDSEGIVICSSASVRLKETAWHRDQLVTSG